MRADWPGVVGVAGEEDEAAAGGEPRSLEVPSQPRVNRNETTTAIIINITTT